MTDILLLGTYHFMDMGGHLINTENDDILSDKRQKELEQVLDKIIKFNPTKIVVEYLNHRQLEMDELYKEYHCNGIIPDSQIINDRSEIFQIGFKLAKRMKHEKVYAVDKQIDLPMEALQYAQENDVNIYNQFMEKANALGREFNNVIKRETIIGILKYLNNPERISNEHSDLYLYTAQIAAGNQYYGAETLTQWYKRNIYIFSNLQSLAEDNDRILMVYGAGHLKILSDFISNYHSMRLVDANMFL